MWLRKGPVQARWHSRREREPSRPQSATGLLGALEWFRQEDRQQRGQYGERKNLISRTDAMAHPMARTRCPGFGRVAYKGFLSHRWRCTCITEPPAQAEQPTVAGSMPERQSRQYRVHPNRKSRGCGAFQLVRPSQRRGAADAVRLLSQPESATKPLRAWPPVSSSSVSTWKRIPTASEAAEASSRNLRISSALCVPSTAKLPARSLAVADSIDLKRPAASTVLLFLSEEGCRFSLPLTAPIRPGRISL